MNANDTLFSTPMPPQEVSVDVLSEKYAKGDESTVAHVRARVARALAAHETEALRLEMEQRFLWAQDHGFIPAGRINSAAGLGLKILANDPYLKPEKAAELGVELVSLDDLLRRSDYLTIHSPLTARPGRLYVSRPGELGAARARRSDDVTAVTIGGDDVLA